LPSHNNTTLAVVLVVVIILLIITGRLANPYRNLHKPPTPVELAKNSETRETLLNALKWDFVFIPVYTTGLVLLCLIAGRAGARLQLVSLRFTWWIIVVVIAGVSIDIVENIALIKVTNPSSATIWESIARFCKCGKYFSPILGNLYFFIVGIRCLLRIGSQ